MGRGERASLLILFVPKKKIFSQVLSVENWAAGACILDVPATQSRSYFFRDKNVVIFFYCTNWSGRFLYTTHEQSFELLLSDPAKSVFVFRSFVFRKSKIFWF